jgi:hypothetical protein
MRCPNSYRFCIRYINSRGRLTASYSGGLGIISLAHGRVGAKTKAYVEITEPQMRELSTQAKARLETAAFTTIQLRL